MRLLPATSRAALVCCVALALAVATFVTLVPHALAQPGCAANEIFTSQSFSVAGGQQRHAEASDLNGDGIPDLVISLENSVAIARGTQIQDGRILYDFYRNYPVGLGPTGTAIADFNADGIKDIAVAIDSGDLVLLRGLGSGGVGNAEFESYLSLPTGSVWDVAAADLDGDGVLDLVTGSRNGPVLVYRGLSTNGVATGQFVSFGSTPTAGSCKGLELADLNRDGILDVAVAGENVNTTVLIGGGSGGVGDGTFLSGRVLSGQGSTYDVTVGDFNRDGIPDVATANYTNTSVSVFLGTATFDFNTPIIHPVAGSPLGIASEDFDDDGYEDLVVAATGAPNGAFAYFRNSGTVSAVSDGFGTPVLYGPASVAYGITAARLNQDDRFDVLVPVLNNNSIMAAFNGCQNDLPRSLTIEIVGSGTVEKSPDQASYPANTVVQLTAIPSPDWSFSHWEIDATGSANPTNVMMTINRRVRAVFLIHQRTLTVSLAGAGTGTVARSPDQPTYDLGSTVRLTATAAFGSLFAGWSGDVTSAANPVDVVMNADKAITATFERDETLVPRIVTVADVPLDQGGKIKLRWLASTLEVPGADPQNLMTQYFIWREIPEAAYLRAQAHGEEASPRVVRRTATNEREYFWEFVVALPASRFEGYSYTAATTSDSTELGNPYTSFLVQARNAAGTRWFDSNPDSGYSVDNLSPTAPGPVVAQFGGTANTFHWGPSRAPDLRGYRLHRGTHREFVPDATNLVVETRDTSYVDDEPLGAFYKLAALDIHGNRSRYVTISAGGPVPAIASLVLAEGHADRILLSWYVNEPAAPATIYRRTRDTEWSSLGVHYADGRGYLDYEDRDILTGLRYGYRLGIMNGEEEVFFAETEVLAEDLRFAIDGVIPNPSRGDRLGVRFSLPSDGPATLELLDVSGRLVTRQEVAGHVGRQAAQIQPGSRVEPGLYWIRLRQGTLERSTRAVVIE